MLEIIGVVVKINSIVNLNFKSSKEQEKESKLPHKAKLFLGSLIGVEGVKLTKDEFFPSKNMKEPELKTLKEMLTKENLKATGKIIGKYLGLSLIVASLINFFLDEEKADKFINDFITINA